MAEEKRTEIPIQDGNSEAAKEEAVNETTAKEETLKDEAAKEDAVKEEAVKEEAEEAADSEKQDAEKKEAEKKEAEKKEAERQESERYLRLLADFQNFRQRTEKEKADIRSYANEKVIGELLPVVDNFERALQTKTDDIESYAKGMEMILGQLLAAIEGAGVKEIPAEGEMFDPNKHNAVMTEEVEELEDGIISKVLQKGYTLNGRVIRPSMVAVVKK